MMFRIGIFIFTALILMNLLIPSGYAGDPEFSYTIPQATVAPNIDGKLDDGLWSAFEPVEWGNINTGGEVDKNRFSKSWAAYDEKFIYVAFENMEPKTGSLTTATKAHDGGVWNDDENEIFMEPANAGTKPYFHIMINAANVTEDAENGGIEAAWEPDLESETQVYNNKWVLELKIPFDDLGYKEAPVGEEWGWNFNRHIMAGDDIWTGWSLTGASFHTPDKFGVLTFGLDKAAVGSSGKLAHTWGGIKR